MSGIVGNAVSDRMKYGVKQAAVRSECSLRNIKASNGTSFSQSLGTEIVFELPANANGTYCDFSKTFIRLTKSITGTNSTSDAEDAIFRYERGPESMIRRLQIYDASGTLLESIEHYNECYAVQELLTASASQRVTSGHLTNECYTASKDANVALSYPDLGGAVAMMTADNQISQLLNVSNRGTTIPAKANDVDGSATVSTDVCFQLSSALFGGSAHKYLPFTAVNGLRFVLTLESIANTYNSDVDGCEVSSVTISDPTMFYSVIRVDPMVDASLIAAARGDDGLIRIHAQRWAHFSHTVPDKATSDEYVVPIRVSSLKGIFFGFTLDKSGQNNQVPDNDSITSFKDGNMTNMKSAFIHNGLYEYQFMLDGAPVPSTPVQVGGAQKIVNDQIYTGRGTNQAEQMMELARACHVNQKTFNADHLSLMTGTADKNLAKNMRNMIYGCEFESFSNKSNVIESGTNTLNSNVSLRMSFAAENAYRSVVDPSGTTVNAWYSTGDSAGSSYTNVQRVKNLRVFCLYDVFLLIDPGTGIMRTEI